MWAHGHETPAASTRVSLVLFLDFDGTTHPARVGTDIDLYFSQVDILAAWLREHPSVQIVISSSWREQYKLAELKDLLFHAHEDLKERVVGVTPVLKHISIEALVRESECRLWLYDNEEDYDYAAWVALDDQPDLFTSLATERLVLCDPSTGLTKNNLDLAWQLLQRFLGEVAGRRARRERTWEPLLILQDQEIRLQPLPDERHQAEPVIEVLTEAEEAEIAAKIVGAKRQMEEATRAADAAAASRKAAWLALPEAQRWSTLFLDIDEVLCVDQPYAGASVHRSMADGGEPDQQLLLSLFSPEAVAALGQAHESMLGRLRYVVSSSWREHFSREQLEPILARTGLGFVADNLHPGAAWRCRQAQFRPDRAADIEGWLDHFHCGEPFVILDDHHSGGMLNFHRHLPDSRLFGRVVLCQPGVGLQSSHLADIVTALRRAYDV